MKIGCCIDLSHYDTLAALGYETIALAAKDVAAWDEQAFEAAKGKLQAGPLHVTVRSITTQHDQDLYLSGEEADKIRGKRVLIVDDVISTGESLRAMEELVEKAGGTVAGRMAVLAEGDAQERKDIIYLNKLPVFNADGTVKE